MLNVYSRARDGETLLSRSFRAKEFACKDGTDPLFVDSELVQVLQAIRDHFGAPVVITSGYRTAAHNRAVGGAVYSQHQYGRAADIRVSGVPVEQLAAYAETLLPGTGGIGRNPALRSFSKIRYHRFSVFQRPASSPHLLKACRSSPY